MLRTVVHCFVRLWYISSAYYTLTNVFGFCQEGDGVEDTLLSLTSLELHLFIAVLHIHGRTQHHGGAVGGVSSAAGGAAASMAAALGAISQQGAPAVMKVANVFMLCDMLVEVFKQNVSIVVHIKAPCISGHNIFSLTPYFPLLSCF